METLTRSNLNQWYKNFEDALKGWKRKLELVVPENIDINTVANQINEERNAQRRDVYARNIRVGFDEADQVIEYADGRLPETKPHKTNSTYSEADFRQSGAIDMEGVYLGALDTQRRVKTPFLTPTELVEGNRVVIWIKDHFYENQTAIVIGYRALTNEYLVEIVSKKPHKRGYSTDPDAKALMYVKLHEVKLCRRAR